MHYWINIFSDVTCELRRHGTLDDAIEEVIDTGDFTYVETVKRSLAGNTSIIDIREMVKERIADDAEEEHCNLSLASVVR